MQLNKKALAVLSAGHLATDINQGALPAHLPFFKEALNLTLALSCPLLILFYYSSGFMTFVFLGISGMVLISTFALTTVMGQALLPQQLGMASGMMVGFTMSAGGLGVTLLGVIADAWGVPMAVKSIFALPFIAFILGLLVKYPLEKERDG